MNLRTTTLIFLFAVGFQNCNKKDERYHYENKIHEQKLLYTGNDSSVRSVVVQLNTSAFLRGMRLDSLYETRPDFDRHIWFGRFGDSLHYLLVPFVNRQELLVSYLRVGVYKKTVAEVSRISYASDYLNGSDSGKGWRGAELAALHKSGVLLPESFDTLAVRKALDKENAAVGKVYKKNGKYSGVRSEVCDYHIQCSYYTVCDPDFFNAVFINEFRNRMASHGANVDVISNSYLNVSGSGAGYSSGVFYETLSYVSNLHSCAVSVQYVNITTQCWDPGGENPPPGGGGTTPSEPCQQDANAMIAADFEAYCAASIPEEKYEYSESYGGGETEVKVWKWIIAQATGWKLAARTKVTLEYLRPLNPDIYLRKRKLTLEHLETFFDDNSNIFITTRWREDGHLETYTYNNTTHPRGDSQVWGTLNFQSNVELEIEKDTKCGKVKGKVDLNKELHPENTLHVII